MTGTMKTAVMTEPKKIRLGERPIPAPKPDEVLAKIEYVGIGGSDLTCFESDNIQRAMDSCIENEAYMVKGVIRMQGGDGKLDCAAGEAAEWRRK